MSDEQFETLNDPEPEPTPEPVTQDTQQKATYQQFLDLKKTGMNAEQATTALKTNSISLFAEALSHYSSEKEARTHRKDIAKELDVAESLIYKALKKVPAFAKPQHTYKEATLRTSKPQEMPITNDETPPAPTPDTSQPPTTAQPAPPQIIAPPYLPEVEAQKTALATLIKGGWNGLCAVLDASEANLTDAEGDKMGALWLPTAQKRIPTIIGNPEIIAVAGSAEIMLPKIRKIIDVRKAKAKKQAEEEKLNLKEQPAAEPPAEQPAPTQPAEPKIERAAALDRC